MFERQAANVAAIVRGKQRRQATPQLANSTEKKGQDVEDYAGLCPGMFPRRPIL